MKLAEPYPTTCPLSAVSILIPLYITRRRRAFAPFWVSCPRAFLGKFVVKWKGDIEVVGSVCWSPDDGQVVSGLYVWTVRVWDAKSGEPAEGPKFEFHRNRHKWV